MFCCVVTLCFSIKDGASPDWMYADEQKELQEAAEDFLDLSNQMRIGGEKPNGSEL